ncbi:hypothetical protein OEZ85_006641 [Tetradesmus obliquus]|uniref:PWWP domain-containing protein n=1 Tax=Tetradesmus obliquus TaxID=3088 RepID=A0ABY8TV71_TETOB|nr:hypothetical protein OEZ85_006641 [Tetradesmus obliquus]
MRDRLRGSGGGNKSQGNQQQASTPQPLLPEPVELVWAKVPGWQWWPARLLPLAKEARTTEEERLVLFLVDRTVARVPSTPPLFHVHYNRFLGATYGNKKLFQAVEEARGMLVDAPAGPELPLLAYPQPVKEDMRKSGRQLLQFLRQAAVEPKAPLNKLQDQTCKRVLHAVRHNRLLAEGVKPFVLPADHLAATAAADTAAGAAGISAGRPCL